MPQQQQAQQRIENPSQTQSQTAETEFSASQRSIGRAPNPGLPQSDLAQHDQSMAELKQVPHTVQGASLNQQLATTLQQKASLQPRNSNPAAVPAPTTTIASHSQLPAVPLQQQPAAEKQGTQGSLPGNNALVGQNPMLVDGQAADVGSLQKQAADEASKTLRKSLGTATAQQMSLRQQMQQQMLQKEESDANQFRDAGLGMDDPVAQLGEDQTGLTIGSSLTHVKAAANPQLTRIGLSIREIHSSTRLEDEGNAHIIPAHGILIEQVVENLYRAARQTGRASTV
eukprot:758003-Hanusia_phi.AAC.7